MHTLRLSRLVSVLSRGLVPVLALSIGGALWSAPASGQSKPVLNSGKEVALVPVVGAAKEVLRRSLLAKGDQGLGTMHHECPNEVPHVQNIACNSSVSEALTTTGSCVLDDGTYVDFFSFSGTAGQQVTITLTSTAFDAYLFLLDPSATPVDQDDDSGGGTNSQIVFTLTSSGTWFIAVNQFEESPPGAYNLALVCTGGGGGGGACTPNATTLCLNNGRFRVTATFATNTGQSGNGMAVAETTDTGMFWFFSANNIEMIIKVVNGCALNSRYWVFAGGLTNVAVTMTVTDTANGTVRTYANPQGTAFAPIQDTSAFATCP
ncbi:MAG TPA: PPC domain-containing protein [Thermoanaerobaculia bacterium]|nr:PPC domain-containing protein [Thermoanaerobaculia bacterium]